VATNIPSVAERAKLFRIWEAYDQSLPPFAPTKKMVVGYLRLPSDAAAIVERAPEVRFVSGLTLPGWVTVEFNADEERVFNDTSTFRIINGPLEDLLTECVRQLRDPVTAYLESCWRILNVRVWTTPPHSTISQMYSWHMDGMPDQIFKIMVYFTPMDAAHGGLETLKGPLLGPAGTWVLFWNSKIDHRGKAGASRIRASAEITLCRSVRYDLVLHQPGINAHWPERP